MNHVLPLTMKETKVDDSDQRDIQLEVCLSVSFESRRSLFYYYAEGKAIKGTVVAPSLPREQQGIYWGYSVRLAPDLGSVFTEGPYSGGYDLTIGTSEKGENADGVELPTFK